MEHNIAACHQTGFGNKYYREFALNLKGVQANGNAITFTSSIESGQPNIAGQNIVRYLMPMLETCGLTGRAESDISMDVKNFTITFSSHHWDPGVVAKAADTVNEAMQQTFGSGQFVGRFTTPSFGGGHHL